MKHLYLLAVLLVWLGCKPNTKNAVVTAPISSSDSVSNNPSTIDNTTKEPPSTYPKVWFTTIVDNALLRDTPSTKSVSLWSLPKGAILLWTGMKTSFKESIAISGEAKPLPWLQISKTENDSLYLKWIYGGCVAPYVFDFNPVSDSVAEITKRWLVLDKIDSVTFLQVRKKAKTDTLRRTDISEVDSMPIRIKIKGREKVIRDNICICEGYADYTLISEAQGWYIISGGYWEWGDFWFIRAADGKEYRSMGSSAYGLQFSPSHRFWAFPSQQGYGDIFNAGGLEIFDSRTARSFGLQLPQNNFGSGEVTDIVWQTDQVLYFKTYSNTYFKVELKAIFE